MIIKKSILILLAALFLGGCGMTRRGTIPWENEEPTSSSGPVIAASTGTFTDAGTSKNVKQIRESLELAYNDWKGVPYLFGGSGYGGVDCSAFMQIVFEDYFSRKLPRTTREQLRIGTKVSKGEIKTGDMVFFKTGATTYHVGVMINDSEFLHASTSAGVTISELADSYWQQKYLATRRILN